MSASAANPPVNTPRRAIVIDDSELVRWAISRALTAEGFAVEQAGTLAEAEAKLAGIEFDLVVAADSLEREDMGELLTTVRGDAGAAPLVLLAEQARSPAWRPSRVTSYVRKPFSIDEVLAAVRLLTAPADAPIPIVSPDDLLNRD